MNENPKDLADEAIALRLLADALYSRANELKERTATAMGRGTLYSKLPDGTELGSINVPKGSTIVEVDLDLLLPWVKQAYPEEVVETVRPSFLEVLRDRSKKAGRSAAPQGEVDFPGIYVYTAEVGAPRIKASEEGKERARAAVDAVLERAIPAFALNALPGGSE